MTKDFNSLRVAVLQTGRSIEEARADHGDYDDMCKAFLGREPSEATTFAVLDGEFPQSIEPFDVFLVTGSKYGVYEEHPWIAPLEALIREIYAAEKKLIGICFGHQVIATALGGRVVKSDRGFGVGAMDYSLAIDGASSAPITLYAWHQDQVVAAPEGAEIIVTSEFCQIAGLRYGDRAISVQPHPEFTREYMAALAEARRGSVISDKEADGAIASLDRSVDVDLVRELFIDFAAA